MSERLHAPAHPEAKTEPHHTKEHHERLEHLEAIGKAQEHQLRVSTDQVRQTVEQHALSSIEQAPLASEILRDEPTPAAASRELRAMTYKRALTRLQKRESVTDRSLSKIVHNGPLFAASESLSKTIARPSGFIGGGLCALLGTSIFMAFARHYGFTYNNLLFGAFFVGGMVVGLIAEVAIRTILRRRAQTHIATDQHN